MVLSHENFEEHGGLKPHPYWYARVIKMFHVNVWVLLPGSPSKDKAISMPVLWVHWFGREGELNFHLGFPGMV